MSPSKNYLPIGKEKKKTKIVAPQPSKLGERVSSSEKRFDKILIFPVPFFLIGSTSNYFQIKSVKLLKFTHDDLN